MYPNLIKEMERRELSYRALVLGAGLNYQTVQPKLKGRPNVGEITLPEALAIRKFLGVKTDLEILFKRKGENGKALSKKRKAG